MSSKPSSLPNPDLRPSRLALTILATWGLSIALLIGISAAPPPLKAPCLLLLSTIAFLSILSHSTHPPANPSDLLPNSRATRTQALLLWQHAGHLRWTIVARTPHSANAFRRLRIHLRFPPRLDSSARIRAQS